MVAPATVVVAGLLSVVEGGAANVMSREVSPTVRGARPGEAIRGLFSAVVFLAAARLERGAGPPSHVPRGEASVCDGTNVDQMVRLRDATTRGQLGFDALRVADGA